MAKVKGGKLIRTSVELQVLLALDEYWRNNPGTEPQTDEDHDALLDELLGAERERNRGRQGGVASGSTRQRRRLQRFTTAAEALNRLRTRNPVKAYTVDDIAAESKLSPGTVKHLGKSSIYALADSLRKPLPKK
jgi:hypothetical protein